MITNWLLISLAITWVIGLAPALIVRFLVVGEALPARKATLIAAATSISFAILFLIVNAILYGTASNPLAWLLVFFVARWIMMRDPPITEAAEAQEDARRDHMERAYEAEAEQTGRRNRLIEGLEQIAADPDAAPEDRQRAAEKLREYGEKPPEIG
jgi:hypothetical protein